MTLIHLPPGCPERDIIKNGLIKLRNDAESLLAKEEPIQIPEQPLFDRILGKQQDILGPVLKHAGVKAFNLALRDSMQRYSHTITAIESGLDISMDLAEYGKYVEWSEK